MNSPRPPSAPRAWGRGPASRWLRWLVVAVGVLAGQLFLYGPALTGARILLPLDLLALPNLYLPADQASGIAPQDMSISDLVLQYEPERRFLAAEYRKGNFPLWLPYQYAGSPLVWPRYSPFALLGCTTESPRILPWVELLAALVAGSGAYAFARRSLGLGFWPSTFAAWAYPLTGFFVLWQGFPTSGAIYWFPWLLWAVDRAVARSAGRSGWREWVGAVGALAVVTALVLVSGHIDVAGQALVGAGLFGLFAVARAARGDGLRGWRRGIGVLLAGWLLGFALAAPHFWPLLEYAPTGARMERRAAGAEERPPTGLQALPEVVMPDIHGTHRRGSLWIMGGNQIESAAAGYAGLVTALFLVPLAWSSRRHRPFIIAWLLLGGLGLAWCLDVPGLVSVLRLPGLNLFSHNRLTFLTGFGLTLVAAIGLEQLAAGEARWRRWHAVVLAAVLGLGGYCAFRSQIPPEPLASQLGELVRQGRGLGWVRTAADLAEVRAWFDRMYLTGLTACALVAGLWIAVGVAGRWSKLAVIGVAALALGELGFHARGRRPLCDEALYYPRLALPEQLAKSEPGRILGYGCFIPTLSQSHGLNDLRGYDSVDPVRVTDLLLGLRDAQSVVLPYALTQWFVPRISITQGRVLTLPPALDMLGVRYLLFSGVPPPAIQPPLATGGYWALINDRVLPRVFVPSRIEEERERGRRVQRVTADTFDPRTLALVETDARAIPAGQGTGRVVAETPNHVRVEARLEKGGLVVLGDAWAPGWRATVNGAAASVYCVNHCLRGVVAPAGTVTIEFVYRPTSVIAGWAIAGSAALLLAGAVGLSRRARREAVPEAANAAAAPRPRP